VVLDPFIVNRDDIAQRTRCILGHGGSFSLSWLRFCHLQFSQIRGRQPLHNCAKDSVRHRGQASSLNSIRSGLGVSFAHSPAGFEKISKGEIIIAAKEIIDARINK
jgi:hypothetical protein